MKKRSFSKILPHSKTISMVTGYKSEAFCATQQKLKTTLIYNLVIYEMSVYILAYIEMVKNNMVQLFSGYGNRFKL